MTQSGGDIIPLRPTPNYRRRRQVVGTVVGIVGLATAGGVIGGAIYAVDRMVDNNNQFSEPQPAVCTFPTRQSELTADLAADLAQGTKVDIRDLTHDLERDNPDLQVDHAVHPGVALKISRVAICRANHLPLVTTTIPGR